MNLPSWKRVVTLPLTTLLIGAMIVGCSSTASESQEFEQEVAESRTIVEYSEPTMVEVIPIPEPEPEPELEPEPEPVYDRTKPIYEVYKNGYPVSVPAEWQWYIRDLCEQYDFPEEPVYGCILAESTFKPDEKSSHNCYGLAQINPYWIHGANIEHFTDDYSSRNLYDPYDNLLTMFELWCYARDAYDIDVYSVQGQKDLLYWHNSGKFVKNVNWPYSERCLGYASELVVVQE